MRVGTTPLPGRGLNKDLSLSYALVAWKDNGLEIDALLYLYLVCNQLSSSARDLIWTKLIAHNGTKFYLQQIRKLLGRTLTTIFISCSAAQAEDHGEMYTTP